MKILAVMFGLLLITSVPEAHATGLGGGRFPTQGGFVLKGGAFSETAAHSWTGKGPSQAAGAGSFVANVAGKMTAPSIREFQAGIAGNALSAAGTSGSGHYKADAGSYASVEALLQGGFLK